MKEIIDLSKKGAEFYKKADTEVVWQKVLNKLPKDEIPPQPKFDRDILEKAHRPSVFKQFAADIAYDLKPTDQLFCDFVLTLIESMDFCLGKGVFGLVDQAEFYQNLRVCGIDDRCRSIEQQRLLVMRKGPVIGLGAFTPIEYQQTLLTHLCTNDLAFSETKLDVFCSHSELFEIVNLFSNKQLKLPISCLPQGPLENALKRMEV